MKKIIAVTNNPAYYEKIEPYVDDVIEKIGPSAIDSQNRYILDIQSLRDGSVAAGALHCGMPLAVCLTNDDSCDRGLLVQNGISSVVRFDDFAAHGIDAIDAGIAAGEQVLVYEPDARIRMMLQNIFSSFGTVITDISSSTDPALDENEYSFMFANIGTRSFDINQYLKRAVVSPRIKSIPFIPYRSDGGVFVSDIICGLNRVAKAVFTAEELYSFIVSSFVLKRVNELIGQLSAMRMEGITSSFGEMSFRSLYHRYGYEMLSAKPDVRVMEHVGRLSGELEKAILCMNRHRWLVLQDEKCVTCGLGA